MTPDTERNERVTSQGQTASGQAELSQSPDQSAEIEAERAASGGDSNSQSESAQSVRPEEVESAVDEDSQAGQAAVSPAAAPAESATPSANGAQTDNDRQTAETNDTIDASSDGQIVLTLQRPGSDEDSGSSTTVTAHYALAGEAALQSSGAAATPAVEALSGTAQPAGSWMQGQLDALRDRMDDALGREPASGNQGTVWSGTAGLDALRDKAADLLSGWRDGDEEAGEASASSPLEALRDNVSDLQSGWRNEDSDAGAGPAGLSSAISDSPILALLTDNAAETEDASSGGLLARIFDGDLASVPDHFGSGADTSLFDDLNLSSDWPVNDADGGHHSGWDLFDSAS